MARFARMLSTPVDRIVVDKTGLTGTWNLELEFTPFQPASVSPDARDGVDLESLWTPWKAREVPVRLECGRHFDVVVFGISLAGIPYVGSELVAASPRWQAMLERVETVRTQAVQLWLKPDGSV